MTAFTTVPKSIEDELSRWSATTSRRDFLKRSGLLVVSLTAATMAEQFDQAAANLMTALRAAGGLPEHLVSLQVFVTAVAEYKASLHELGDTWRRHFGRHYPAMGLFGVTELFDPAAKVELMGVAVIGPPDG